MGHAVYSISDPRAENVLQICPETAHEKGPERLCPLQSGRTTGTKNYWEERHIYKGVSANIDFYSGLVYSMLDIPHEFTPIFAIGRIVGWSAHRIEELVNAG